MSKNPTWRKRTKGTSLEGLGGPDVRKVTLPEGFIPLDHLPSTSPTWDERIKGTLLDPNLGATVAERARNLGSGGATEGAPKPTVKSR